MKPKLRHSTTTPTPQKKNKATNTLRPQPTIVGWGLSTDVSRETIAGTVNQAASSAAPQLLPVVARARAQVRRVDVQAILQLRLVQATIRVRAIIHDIRRIHDAIRVLLDLLRRRTRPALLLRQRVLIRELRRIRIQNRTRIDTAKTRVLIPPMIRIQARLHQQLQQLIARRLRPAASPTPEHPRRSARQPTCQR